MRTVSAKQIQERRHIYIKSSRTIRSINQRSCADQLLSPLIFSELSSLWKTFSGSQSKDKGNVLKMLKVLSNMKDYMN